MSNMMDAREVESPAVPGVRSWLRRLPFPGTLPKHVGWSPDFDHDRGDDVRVALLDGGLDWGLPVFHDALVLARDFTGTRGLPDPTGRGAAHASLLVAQPESGFEGLIPHGELLFGQVLWPGGRGDCSGAVARGVRWAMQCGADVIILPFGTSRGSSLVAQAIAAAAKAGCAVVAAAGNRGPEEICFPAWLDEVVAVTGVDSSGRPVAGCCASGRVDRLAPGEEVPAMGPQGPALLSGSSPAAVIAGGLLALQHASLRRDTQAEPFPDPVPSHRDVMGAAARPAP